MTWHMDLVGCKFNPRPDRQECRFHLTHRVHRRPRVVCAPGRMDFVGCKFNLRQDQTRVGPPVVITDQSASLAAQARNDRTDRPVFSVYIAEWHTDLLGCKFNPSWATSSTSDKNFCKLDFLLWSPIGPDPWRHRLALIAQFDCSSDAHRGVAHGPLGLQVQPSTRSSRRPGFSLFFRGL